MMMILEFRRKKIPLDRSTAKVAAMRAETLI